MLAAPLGFFVALLVLASLCSRQSSSRVLAFLALAVLLVLAWVAVALAYAMTDNHSVFPALMGAAFVVFMTVLGCIAFRRKPS